MQVVHERCCGLDVHKKTVVACILMTLVNAQHMKAIPGRKTDMKESEWLADLLRHGLRHPPVSFHRPRFVNCATSPGTARVWFRSVRERSIECKKCWKPPI